MVVNAERVPTEAGSLQQTTPIASARMNLTVTSDGRTLISTNVSGSLEIVDLERVLPRH
jgi:hypothetical protein